jgi:hypothetical protein
MITSHAPAIELAHGILERAARTTDRPRPIDRYIDYFEGPARFDGQDESRLPYGSRAQRAGTTSLGM